MQKGLFKLALFLALIAAVELCFGWAELYAHLKDFAENNTDPLWFLLVMSVGAAVGLPVSWLYFFSATAFGIWTAWGLCLAGIFSSSLLGYFLARFLLPKSALSPLLKRFNINADADRAACNLNFFIRAIPGVPYFLQNFILSQIGTPLGMYMAMTLAVQGPIALAMNFFAESLKISSWQGVAAGAVLIITLTCVHRVMLRIYAKGYTAPPAPEALEEEEPL